MTGSTTPTRHEPLMPNAGYIARREYAALVRGRLFFVSTLVLAGLAMFVAFLPVAAKLVDRGSQTTVAVVASDQELADRTRNVLQTLLDGSGGGFELIQGVSEPDVVEGGRP